jgi:elongation factor G
MKEYSAGNLRNVVLLGHGSTGKTSLGEAMLFDAGAISRVGRVEDKSTVSDFDDEEQSRGLSVNTSVLPLEWQGTKINLLDAPGFMDFVGEVVASISATEGAVLLICAASGLEVGAELHWGFINEASRPRIIFINKMDRENANFSRVMEQLKAKFETTLVPVQLPIGAQSNFAGVIDLIKMKAYMGDAGTEQAIPAEMVDIAETARLEMMEFAAEVDDELMLKYLDGEELTNEEITMALAKGTQAGSLVPVLAGSATKNAGVRQLLDAIAAFLPSPAKAPSVVTQVGAEESMTLPTDAAGPLVAQVFKTLADPFVGKLTYFRVWSGTISSDSRVRNAGNNEEERIAQLFMIRGKEQTPVKTVKAGDIGAVAKLGVTGTSDTLCDQGALYEAPAIVYPQPLFSAAVFPKTKSDLDKLGSSLVRLVEEDPTLHVERHAETNETILSGMGESHIAIATRRLAQKFGVEVETELPTIAYRETISRIASAQGRHKKQTGGRGQFGDVWCRFEPLERGAGFEFASEIFGGSVPRNYVPAVEKGIHEILPTGAIAGFSTVDIKCILYDGSFHPVDSSELAFKLAAQLSFKAAVPQASPVLLEPIVKIVVTVPETFMGDILGDLNTRRAQVQGMEQAGGNGMVTALVPLAEIQRYATDLRAMTQGRGTYAMEVSHYDIVPAHMVDKIRADAEAHRERAAERAAN